MRCGRNNPRSDLIYVNRRALYDRFKRFGDPRRWLSKTAREAEMADDSGAVSLDARYFRSKAEELSRDALAATPHNREMLLHMIHMLRTKADEVEKQEAPPSHENVAS
jgi:hypothetical protein